MWGFLYAFFLGWGKRRRILLASSMLRAFPLDEIEVILAHELGHFIHHDIWKRLVVRGFISLGCFSLIALDLAFVSSPLYFPSFKVVFQVIFIMLFFEILIFATYLRHVNTL